jgi:threonine dehydratase
LDARSGAAAVSADAVDRAARDLAPYLPATPLQHSAAFTEKARCHVHLKLESIQPVRSFKVRGALNKLIHIDPAARAQGVITASAGNHGLGVAYAARLFRVPATVFVPEHANPLKVEAIKRLGARVIPAGRNYAEANHEATEMAARGTATFVPAFDDPDVVAGQGTVAIELLSQLRDFDTVLVPVGGGGLIAGVALYLKARRPRVRVIGVEPAGADAMLRSLEARQVVTLDRVETIADGLAASAPGRLTLQIALECVDAVLRVEEEELLRAIRLCVEWEHVLAEPAGAAGVAALLYHHRPAPDERVVVLLTGGSVTDEVLLRALRFR